ncbi:MAG: hypothetical protein AAFZ38_11740 [Myxococcota bacterium]
MRSLPRPSRRLTPQEFYTRFAPELWTALIGNTHTVGWVMRVAVELEKGQHRFGLLFSAGELTVQDSLPDDPHLTFRSSLDSYRTAMFDLLPRVLRHLEESGTETGSELVSPLLQPKIDALRDHPGSIEVDFLDDAGDRASVDVLIASGDGPKTGIHATDDDLWSFLEEGARPSRFLQSRVELSGDIAYVIRLLHAVERG